MSKEIWFRSASVFIVATLVFLFVSCFEQPVSPWQSKNAKLYMTVKSNTLKKNVNQYVDSVGNTITIGLTSNLPNYVDSVLVTITTADGVVDTGKMLKNIITAKSDTDTVWYTAPAFISAGLKTIIAQAFIQDNYKYSDSIKINIIKKPGSVIVPPRTKPRLTITGVTTITTAQACTLTVAVLDSPNQLHTFTVTQDGQPVSFTPPTFTWTPPPGFTGTSTVIFKVADTDSPSYFDTALQVITVSSLASTPPTPKNIKAVMNKGVFAISWDSSAVDDYILFRAGSVAGPFTARDTVIGHSFADSIGTLDYYYYVKAHKGADTSAASSMVFSKDFRSSVPHWSSDTVLEPCAYGTKLSLTLATICSGDSLTFSLASSPVVNGDTVIGGVFSYTFADKDTNNYYPKVIAMDGKGNADTMTIHLWATQIVNTAKALTAFSFATPAVTGAINETSKTIALTVPSGTDVTALKATFATTGASVKVGTTVQTSGTTANNFTAPVTYTVVAGDGSVQAYVVTVTVTVVANTAKALTAFSFTSPAATGIISDSLKTVSVTIPSGTDVTALKATFTTTGASVKVGTAVQVSGTTANNFTSPVTYTVVAGDGSMQTYVVTVTVSANTAKALTSFSFAGLTPVVIGAISDSLKTVALTVPSGTDVTALKATFATTGSSVKVGTALQTSGTTANNFTSPVTYTVVAGDGSTQAYVVTVMVAANTAKAFTIFSFAGLTPAVTGIITESAKTIALTVPFGTDVTTLAATFTTTGASVKVGAALQISGTTTNTFASPVTYTVVAGDGSTQAYVVTVTVAANTAKALTAFSFTSPAASGTITESSKTVAVTVPFGTNVTALVATFTTTGALVKVGTALQTSGTTANNFTAPLSYTVVAGDGSTQVYSVTVTVAANASKALTAFSFAGLTPAVTGTILESAKTVALTVPYGTDISGLVATFATSGTTVKVLTAIQTSGVTANNFSSPVTYIVSASDGSTQAYVVTVTTSAKPTYLLTVTGGTGSGTVSYGDANPIVAMVPAGSKFVKWTVGPGTATIASVTSASTTITLTSGAATVTASFLATYGLTIIATNGTVTKSPDAAQYDSGTVVSLTPVAAPGYRFTGWGGALTGTTIPGSIAMTGAKSVTANFTAVTYALTITATNGSVTKSPVGTQYDSGSVVSLTPVAAPGYRFTGWSGGLTGTTTPGSITMTGPKSVTANFTIVSYTLTITAANGSATKAPIGTQFDSGTVVSLTPVGAPGYRFTGWSGALTGTTTPGSITMTGDKSVIANFAIVTYTLTVTAINGTVAKSPNQPQYDSGSVVMLSAVDGAGTFTGWSGGLTGNANPAYITMTGVKSVTANFALPYTVTFDGQGAGTAPFPATKTVTPPATTVGTLPSEPAKYAYVFEGWWTGTNGNGTQFIGTTTVNQNIRVYAKWVIKDVDGNYYTEVTVGSQVWMVENFRATKFTTGYPLVTATDGTDWDNLIVAGYCFYNNSTDAAFQKKYGALYNWYTAIGGIAPDGWHVPTEADWVALASNTTGKSLASNTDWMTSSNPDAVGNILALNNGSHFFAYPGGSRMVNSHDAMVFDGLGQAGTWWTEDLTTGTYRSLGYAGTTLDALNDLKSSGFSIRLIRNY